MDIVDALSKATPSEGVVVSRGKIIEDSSIGGEIRDRIEIFLTRFLMMILG